MSEIESVAVVGAGFMGTGIAEAVAVSGIPVIVRDVDDAALARAGERIDTSLARAVRGGKLDAASAGAARDLIDLTTQLEVIGETDLVIEAVPEDERLKLSVMEAIDAVVADGAIVASNTSSIPIAELAQAIRQPERVLGLHFFSPVPVMNLVEVVVALDTSERTVDSAKRFVERLGKRPIETKDRSGFIVNMLLVPYLMAAVRMYEEGFASREDIDNGMKLGCGHPMGPLTLCDFIGLDVLYAIVRLAVRGVQARRVRAAAAAEADGGQRPAGPQIRARLLRLLVVGAAGAPPGASRLARELVERDLVQVRDRLARRQGGDPNQVVAVAGLGDGDGNRLRAHHAGELGQLHPTTGSGGEHVGVRRRISGPDLDAEPRRLGVDHDLLLLGRA